MNHLTAKNLATKLTKLGFQVVATSEPDFEQDGMVELTEFIHVQVAYAALNVVRQDGTDYIFYPLRESVTAIVKDLNTALKS